MQFPLLSPDTAAQFLFEEAEVGKSSYANSWISERSENRLLAFMTLSEWPLAKIPSDRLKATWERVLDALVVGRRSSKNIAPPMCEPISGGRGENGVF